MLNQTDRQPDVNASGLKRLAISEPQAPAGVVMDTASPAAATFFGANGLGQDGGDGAYRRYRRLAQGNTFGFEIPVAWKLQAPAGVTVDAAGVAIAKCCRARWF